MHMHIAFANSNADPFFLHAPLVSSGSLSELVQAIAQMKKLGVGMPPLPTVRRDRPNKIAVRRYLSELVELVFNICIQYMSCTCLAKDFNVARCMCLAQGGNVVAAARKIVA